MHNSREVYNLDNYVAHHGYPKGILSYVFNFGHDDIIAGFLAHALQEQHLENRGAGVVL